MLAPLVATPAAASPHLLGAGAHDAAPKGMAGKQAEVGRVFNWDALGLCRWAVQGVSATHTAWLASMPGLASRVPAGEQSASWRAECQGWRAECQLASVPGLASTRAGPQGKPLAPLLGYPPEMLNTPPGSSTRTKAVIKTTHPAKKRKTP